MVCRASELPQPGSNEYARWENQNKGPSILIACWVFTGLALVFVLARLFVRGRILRQLHADDYWCSVGWVCALLCTIFATVATSYGNGKHCVFLTQYEQGRTILWTIISWWPGVLCFSLPKLAVVSLLTRLLNPSRRHRILLWGLPIFSLVNLFVIDMLILFRCSPIQAQWNFFIKDATCLGGDILIGFALYAASFSAFVDLYLSIYPAIVLYKLRIKRKKKLYLSGALGLGCVSCAVAIYKATRIPAGLSAKDVSHSSSDLTIWTVVEGCVIIMACTVPVLAPLLGLLKCTRSTSGSSGKGVADARDRDEHQKHGHTEHGEFGGLENLEDTTRGGSPSTSGGDNQDILMHAWETLYGPEEQGLQYYEQRRESHGLSGP